MAVDPDKPFNREEMYLAKAAGEGTTVPDEPWSRKEAYLEKIGGRIDEAEEDISELDEKVAALATDISLKGSVADYDHLPTDAAVGDAYITEDTGILYVWVGDEWTPLNMQGGSGITELTSADYNYPVNNPDGIAPWLLPPGLYKINTAGVSSGKLKFYLHSAGTLECVNGDTIIRGGETDGSYITYLTITSKSGWNPGVLTGVVNKTNGAMYSQHYMGPVMTTGYIRDNLTTNDNSFVLSASQGKVLNDKFGGMQLVKLTQAQYDALATKDPNTLYIIKAA